MPKDGHFWFRRTMFSLLDSQKVELKMGFLMTFEWTGTEHPKSLGPSAVR